MCTRTESTMPGVKMHVLLGKLAQSTKQNHRPTDQLQQAMETGFVLVREPAGYWVYLVV